MFSRRAFLSNAVKYGASLSLGCSSPPLVNVSGLPDTPKLSGAAPVSVADGFIGLGYEMSSVATPGLLNVDNHRYLNLIRGLGAAGVLRFGGIVAYYTRNEANGTSKAERQNTIITRA